MSRFIGGLARSGKQGVGSTARTELRRAAVGLVESLETRMLLSSTDAISGFTSVGTGATQFNAVQTGAPAGDTVPAISNGTLTLTDSNANEATGIYYNTAEPVAQGNGFAATFMYDMASSATNPPGDGFLFVLQNQATSVLGASSSANRGLPSGEGVVAIGVVTDPGSTTPAGVTLIENGTTTTFPTGSSGSETGNVDFSQVGQAINVTVTYDGSKGLTFTATQQNSTFTHTFTLANTLGQDLAANTATTLAANDAYVGFTGGTGTNDGMLELSNFALTFLGNNNAGSFDPSFGTGEAVNANFAIESTAVQSDGKIVFVGLEPGTVPGTTEAIIERLDSDGFADTTFGTNGMVIDNTASTQAFFGVAIDSDGTIVATGTSAGSALVARYNADGSVDGAFGTAGLVTSALSGSATGYGIGVDASGNIVISGATNGQAFIARYTPAGVLDPTFGSAGVSLLDVPPGATGGVTGSELTKLDIESNGSIAAVGTSDESILAARFTSSGAPDPTFNPQSNQPGFLIVSGLSPTTLAPGEADFTEGMAVDPTGRILITANAGGNSFGLARLNTDGSLDPSFGSFGVASVNFGGNDDADMVAIPPDGSDIIVAGTSTASGTYAVAGTTAVAVAVFDTNGSPDANFGAGGKEVFQATLGAGVGTPRLIRPAAEFGGTTVNSVFGALQNGELVVGETEAGATDASTLRRLFVQPPSLPVGSLTGTVKGKFPAVVVTGTKTRATATVTVHNPSAAISGTVNVSLYLSESGTLSDATFVKSLPRKLKLKQNRSSAFAIRLSQLPSVGTGTFSLIALVTAPDGSETGVLGPQVVLAAPVVTINASGLKPHPVSVRQGKRGGLILTLQNSGNVATTGTATLTIQISQLSSGAGGETIATAPLKVHLAAGKKKTYAVRFLVLSNVPAGSYYLATTLAVASLNDPNPADGSAVSAVQMIITNAP